MIWNKAKECMSRDELAELQGKRLVKLVKYMYQNAQYYRKKMQNLGLEPGDIRGIEDLDKLPFTTQEDLIDAYPLGVFAMSDRNIVRYHASTHRAGMETMVGYTQSDIDIWSECMARSISMADFGKKDVISVAYNYGLCADGLGAHYGAEKVGAAVIPASDCKPATLIALMRRVFATGIISTPSYLMRVAQEVEEKGLKNSLQLKAAICGGGQWTENARKKLQDKLGIKVYDIFGLNELTGPGMACECECQKGMHIQEDFFLTEILELNTLIVLPGGRRGELICTTLQKEGIPLIRYRTMRIAKINYEKCECGRTMARIDRIFESADDIVLIRGSSVFVLQIEMALSELQNIDAFYVVCIRREHNLDVVDIYIEIDRRKREMLSESEEAVKHQVANAVGSVIGIMPRVHCTACDIIQSFAENPMDKKVIVVDERTH
ncbi:MAG: phenylacetate--CoA ligase [Lachnospiraceae bacterium]|nr:phenylacetate--CoA ligase [Lachnospiraceae bacterium]